MYQLLLIFSHCFLLAHSVCSNRNEQSSKPNIIFILVDDVGWNDFGFHGSNQLKTPNIDALAYNGVILNRTYSLHTCTPSRSSLLTGQYAVRLKMQGFPMKGGEDRALPMDVPTMGEIFQKQGYDTNYVGKWHLGYSLRNYTPPARGFNYFLGYYNGFVGYFNYIYPQQAKDEIWRGYDLHKNYDVNYDLSNQYSTHVFTNESIRIIDNHDQSKPLFLIISHLAGHTGDNGTELGVPDVKATKKKYSYIKNSQRQMYAGVLEEVDKSVGAVIKKLNEKCMLNNSIIIFMSDNGAQTSGLYANAGSNWPLRGLKFTDFEGGIRVPAIAFSPLFKKRGYVNNELIHITDFLPSLYYASGGDIKDLGVMDGINQWNTISKNIKTKRSNLLINYDEVDKYGGVIAYGGRYKYLEGSFGNGVYDDYFGDTGREMNNPPYNYQEVLNSDVNIAIEKLNFPPLVNKALIKNLRRQGDLSSCRLKFEKPVVSCRLIPCLFDLWKDPCEKKNLYHEKQKIASELHDLLYKFIEEDLVMQDLSVQGVVQSESNPKLHNNTWCSWKDAEGCPRNKSSQT